jgi:hypothetical protein
MPSGRRLLQLAPACVIRSSGLKASAALGALLLWFQYNWPAFRRVFKQNTAVFPAFSAGKSGQLLRTLQPLRVCACSSSAPHQPGRNADGRGTTRRPHWSGGDQ